jgi:hypothetical protein
MAQNRLKLLAKAEARIFQCVVIDQHFQKRNIAVYLCGPDAFWAPNREGLFDPDRARRCPNWLIEQIHTPPTGVAVFNFKGQKITVESSEGVSLEPAPTGPSKLEEVGELGDESSIEQG